MILLTHSCPRVIILYLPKLKSYNSVCLEEKVLGDWILLVLLFSVAHKWRQRLKSLSYSSENVLAT